MAGEQGERSFPEIGKKYTKDNKFIRRCWKMYVLVFPTRKQNNKSPDAYIKSNLAFHLINKNIDMHRRRQGGGEHRERPPPRNRKNCCRKMVLFPKGLFVATTFPKLAKNSIFLLNFYQKFSKFSQNFPNNLCFSSKRAKK